MALSALEKKAKALSKAVSSLGKSTKPSLSERAGMLATIKGAPPQKGEDGKTPIRGVDYFTPEDIATIKQELLNPRFIADMIKEMQKLPESERLDVSGIRNFQSFVYKGTKYGMHEMMHGGGPTLVAGSNITLTSNTNGTTTIAASAGAFTILSATGTINDVNVTFTFVSLPSFLVINGTVYQQAGGSITWSYLAGTVTLSSAVGTGGSIFGLA